MKTRVGLNTMRTLSKEVVFKDSFDEDDHKRRSETDQSWTFVTFWYISQRSGTV